MFDWADNVDQGAADADIERMGLDVLDGSNSLVPAKVGNLAQVVALPRYLAGFLVVLAFATLGYAVTVNTRRRLGEHATLRALGLTPRGGSLVVATQAATVTGLAMLIGTPIGVLFGSRIWTSIAERATVVVRSVVPSFSIAMALVFLTLAATTAAISSIAGAFIGCASPG